MPDSKVRHASRIDGVFRGFCPQSLFKLQDGTFWLQTDSKTLMAHIRSPKAQVLALDDGMFLRVKGMEHMVNVEQLNDVIVSRIRGKFSGWSGSSAYTLTNGQTWQQASFKTKFAAKYMPVVLIYNSPHGPIMHVAGTSVKVRQIR